MKISPAILSLLLLTSCFWEEDIAHVSPITPSTVRTGDIHLGDELMVDQEEYHRRMNDQLRFCWVKPSLTIKEWNRPIHIVAHYFVDGSLISAQFAPEDFQYYTANAYYHTAGNAAMASIENCSPLKNLPMDEHEKWKDIVLTFDPKDML